MSNQGDLNIESLDSNELSNLSTQSNKKSKKDLRPLTYYFNGTSDELLLKFINKVRAKEGIIKYYLINWENFPTELEKAKDLAKNWTKEFTLNKKYDGYVVNVYFHLIKKKIRFEVKKYSKLDFKHFILLQSSDINEYKTQVFSKLSNEQGVYIFDSSCWENLDLVTCKELGKTWSTELENNPQYSEFKFIIFLNPAHKNIKVTIKSKL
jgi:hypothetical protein